MAVPARVVGGPTGLCGLAGACLRRGLERGVVDVRKRHLSQQPAQSETVLAKLTQRRMDVPGRSSPRRSYPPGRRRRLARRELRSGPSLGTALGSGTCSGGQWASPRGGWRHCQLFESEPCRHERTARGLGPGRFTPSMTERPVGAACPRPCRVWPVLNVPA